MPTSLTPHFTLEEMVFSQQATRLGINNVPSPQYIDSLKNLCENILEPLREIVGKPVNVNSGYRSPDLNRAIGGSPTSQHMEGKAADIRIEGFSAQALFDLINESTLPYDQLIQEFDSWVHVSFDSKRQRRDALYAYRDATGKVRFSKIKPQASM